MTAIANFQSSITTADHLLGMYTELRRHRGLGQRGRLDAANLDLLALPRSAVVAAMSALDSYVHSVLYEQIPIALQADPVPTALCEAMSGILTIKNANTFRDALPLLLAPDSAAELCKRLKEQTLGFLSYQAPEKIIAGYALLGKDGIFDSVANLWPGPGTSADDIKRNLVGYVKRRNQIAHEGDHDQAGQPRAMQPAYASDCRDFISGLAERLNRVVYGI